MKITPIDLNDFRQGIFRPTAVSSSLIPPNSVEFSQNINYDTIIGYGQVRNGTTLLGSTVASNKTPLGLAPYTSSKGTVYTNLLSVFSGASTATIYYFDTSWHASNKTNLSNTLYNRFSMLGNQAFITNSTDGMFSSSDGGATWGTTNSITAATPSIKPSLVLRTKGRLITNGDTSSNSSPSRVHFSSIIDPTPAGAGTITWNTNASTGDWIDINPDDGDVITGFAETATLALVFKNRGMYRLDAITKTVDTQNIFNIGAPSQEAIVSCQGVVYFFSGIDIRSTQGDYPVQISRLGVQDFINAIPQANWSSVAAGTDGLNVYFAIGNVTINTNQDNQTTYNNVVLKFSPRDQSWSIHSYGNAYKFFTNYVTTGGFTLVGSTTAGDVQTLNSGATDNGTPIFYTLETHRIDCGSKAHTKDLTDKIVIYSNYGKDSQLYIKVDEEDYLPIDVNLSQRVNVGKSIDVHGHYFRFKWSGQNLNATAPTLEGIYVENVQDGGIED